MTVKCDYCGGKAKLVSGKVIYPRRADLAGLKFWACLPCDAWTGCHSNSREHKPKGRLANAELRAWKIKAHAAFDPLWQDGSMTRQEAYRHLQTLLGMERQPHMGWMDVETCKRVVALLRSPLPAPVPAMI